MKPTLLSAKVACVALFSGLLLNAQVVATVTSSEPFSLRGSAVPIQGVSNWPVFNGDEIATSSASAMVTFRDGSRVLLGQNTRITITSEAKKTNVKVAKGKVWYDLKSAAKYTVGTVQRVVAPSTVQAGSLAVSNSGEALLSTVDSVPQQLQMTAIFLPRAVTQVPNIYPVSVQYGSLPTGVTAVPGPTPTSVVVP